MSQTYLQQKRMKKEVDPNDKNEVLLNQKTLKKDIITKGYDYSHLGIENITYTSLSSKKKKEYHSNKTIDSKSFESLCNIVSSELNLSNAHNYNLGSYFHDYSSSKSNINSMSNEEKLFNRLFNPKTLFNTFSPPSQFMSSSNGNHMFNINVMEESKVGNFIKLINSNNTKINNDTTNAYNNNQSKCFQDILHNKHMEINHWSKVSKPSIFSISKITKKKNGINYNDCNNKINLQLIKQIFYDNCVKLLDNGSNCLLEKQPRNTAIEEFVSCYYDNSNQGNIIKRILEGIKSLERTLDDYIIVNKSRKMIHRKFYYMFSSEAKGFCLDLTSINKVGLSIDIVSKMCNVPRKSLKRWTIHGCSRKKGCGRKIREPLMEQKLLEWYKIGLQKNKLPSSMILRKKALTLSENKDFLASKGWLEKFKKKYNVQLSSSLKRKSPIANDNIQ